MEKKDIRDTFIRLGKVFELIGSDSEWPGYQTGVSETEYNGLQQLIRNERFLNPWFTEESVRKAISGLAEMLKEANFDNWADKYFFSQKPARVLIVMAGNLPLVGFHDFMCVLLSGNIAVSKLSSSDQRLLPAFSAIMKLWLPELSERMEFALGPVKNIGAVIATGSDNSVSQFNTYFGKYPHIFRKNRTSVAVIDGTETDKELSLLGNDIFDYFGLGCRNVSKILIPEDFDLNRVFSAITDKGEIVNHHKYANNYDYNRTIYLMNRIPFLDNNFVLMKEDEGLFSPLSVIFVQRYKSVSEAEQFLSGHKDDIQTIVGHNYTPFGQSQSPAIDDYADNVDTMKWLNSL